MLIEEFPVELYLCWIACYPNAFLSYLRSLQCHRQLARAGLSDRRPGGGWPRCKVPCLEFSLPAAAGRCWQVPGRDSDSTVIVRRRGQGYRVRVTSRGPALPCTVRERFPDHAMAALSPVPPCLSPLSAIFSKPFRPGGQLRAPRSPQPPHTQTCVRTLATYQAHGDGLLSLRCSWAARKFPRRTLDGVSDSIASGFVVLFGLESLINSRHAIALNCDLTLLKSTSLILDFESKSS